MGRNHISFTYFYSKYNSIYYYNSIQEESIMSHIIFHSKLLTDNINQFIDEYEALPSSERKKIIIDIKRFCEMAHIKSTSPVSIISGIFTAMSILSQEVVVTIPWDKSIYNAYKSQYEECGGNDVDSLDHELWFTSKDVPSCIVPSSNLLSFKDVDTPLTVTDFNRKLEYIDVLYIMSTKTLKEYEEKVKENANTCIHINQFSLKDTYNIKKEMKHNTRLNIIAPQLSTVTWSEYFKCIEHFLIDNEKNKKVICIEDIGLDYFVNMNRNIFDPYKSKLKIITSCKSAVEFI